MPPTDLLGHRWRDFILHPWNHNREALLLALMQFDAAAPDLDEITHIERLLEARKKQHPDDIAVQRLTLADLVAEGGFTFAPYYPVTAKTLWLAAHEPQDWLHLRGRDLSAWIAEIETWAANAIGPHDLPAAVQLARVLRHEHRPFMTLPRPESSTRANAGNSPCPPN